MLADRSGNFSTLRGAWGQESNPFCSHFVFRNWFLTFFLSFFFLGGEYMYVVCAHIYVFKPVCLKRPEEAPGHSSLSLSAWFLGDKLSYGTWI